jgi:hypothetical protein
MQKGGGDGGVMHGSGRGEKGAGGTATVAPLKKARWCDVALSGGEFGFGRAVCGGEEGGSDRRARSSEVWRPAPAHVRQRRVVVGEAGAHDGVGGSGTGSLARGLA